jgi:hypothetical protein
MISVEERCSIECTHQNDIDLNYTKLNGIYQATNDLNGILQNDSEENNMTWQSRITFIKWQFKERFTEDFSEKIKHDNYLQFTMKTN